MRVLSWNVAHNPEIWPSLEALRRQEQCDLALLQEATAPRDSPRARHVTPDPSELSRWLTDAPGYPRPWRTAIAWWGDVAAEPIPRAPLGPVREDDDTQLPESCPGACTAVRIDGTVLVSIYGVWEHLVQGSNASYSLASVHRAISDLTRLWFGRKDPRVVIAGDWNAWYAYKNAPRSDISQWSARSDTVFDRLAAERFTLMGPFGTGPLNGCPCGPRDDCLHVQTYWHQRKEHSTPYQTDYVVATPAVRFASRPRVVTHINGHRIWVHRASDHAPVVFEAAASD